jgi:hypothetical protein
VKVQVDDVLSSEKIIVSFQGDLVGVLNGTTREFKKGQLIEVEVTTLQPLSLRLIEAQRGSAPHLDRSV